MAEHILIENISALQACLDLQMTHDTQVLVTDCISILDSFKDDKYGNLSPEVLNAVKTLATQFNAMTVKAVVAENMMAALSNVVSGNQDPA